MPTANVRAIWKRAKIVVGVVCFANALSNLHAAYRGNYAAISIRDPKPQLERPENRVMGHFLSALLLVLLVSTPSMETTTTRAKHLNYSTKLRL